MNYLEDFSEQGSLEWLTVRIPYVTASDMEKVLAKGQGVTRKNYMVKKLCEQMTGRPTPTYKSSYMQDGNDREYIARDAYQLITGEQVKERGFCYLPKEKIGASVDGSIIGENGGIEIKNIVATEMIDLRLGKPIKSGYVKQMQTQMLVMGWEFVDFIAQSLGSEEHGELPDEYKYKIIRVNRDEKLINEIRSEVARFHQEKEELREKLERSK